MVEVVIANQTDLWLGVEKAVTDTGVDVTFTLKGKDHYFLHWGLSRQNPGGWRAPVKNSWPPRTEAFSEHAVQTPFEPGTGERRLVVHISRDVNAAFLAFDLFCPEKRRWENNRGRDFYLSLPGLENAAVAPAKALETEIHGAEVIHQKTWRLDSGDELAAAVVRSENGYRVCLLTDSPGPLALHWGIAANPRAPWQLPPAGITPAGSVATGPTAMQSPLEEWQGLRRFQLQFAEADAPPGLIFVLHRTAGNQWLKHQAKDLFLPVLAKPSTGILPGLAGRIVEAEKGDHGWTLMHRFNLAHEIIEEVSGDRAGWAILFCWLRFSAIRQLDWQRNYNTKPRELSHAQDRLTLKIAACYQQQPANRDLIRLALMCIGRGGEGQRIRDEILQIMHRHHIKEVGGAWMEQWHQKLHNNTTPDDIAICEAYLAFLRSNGDRNVFYETLAAAGVTRERLASFDRPIKTDPEFIPHLKDGLIHDFENYLKLLKSVHSASDLETAINQAAHLLDDPARAAVEHVRREWANSGASVISLVWKITEVRRHLARRLNEEGDASRERELLYLDLALEDALRMVIERAIHSGFSGEQLVELVRAVTENLLLERDGPELAQCLTEWRRLPVKDGFSLDGARHAKAALDRIGRAVADAMDGAYRELQPVAEQLGQGFGVAEWSLKLFSEEVLRGRPAFVLSLLQRHLDPALRRAGGLGDWQVISPGTVIGKLELVETFHAVQGKRFPQPTIILANAVQGDEEPPEGVCGIITSKSVDLVSHVAVRARNGKLLFATCHDPAAFDRLKALAGQFVELSVLPSGDVRCEPAAEPNSATAPALPPAFRPIARPNLSVRPLRRFAFAPDKVGGKSVNLKFLAENKLTWIQVPRSVAIPFGAFEAILKTPANKASAARFASLSKEIESNPAAKLAELRQLVMDLQLPEDLPADLQTAMKGEGLPWPDDWPKVASRIKQVWASKWNDRAYFSRRARGLPHDAVFMAVLIQEVVPADYAFVIHTVNPFNGNADELYAEVVLGLGETLVGNHPGRALSFVANKANPEPTVLGYPSKSIGLYGGGLIFRSDSNAEDLPGYAGAGLYDSVLLDPPREVTLDYTGDKMVWDPAFRNQTLRIMTRLGAEIEKARSSPQDIEGVFAGGKFFVVQTRPQVGLG